MPDPGWGACSGGPCGVAQQWRRRSSGWEVACPFLPQATLSCPAASCVPPCQAGVLPTAPRVRREWALMCIQEGDGVATLCAPRWPWKIPWGLGRATFVTQRTREKMCHNGLILEATRDNASAVGMLTMPQALCQGLGSRESESPPRPDPRHTCARGAYGGGARRHEAMCLNVKWQL